MVRLVGATLVTLLTVLAAVGWLATPAYAAQYQPALPDQRTLRFTPNQAGGYDVTLTPLRFERDPSAGSPQTTRDYAGQGLGADLGLVDQRTGEGHEHQGSYGHVAALRFAFPFYGQTYDRLYVSDDGAIGLGRRLDSYFSYAYHYGGGIPFLFPLLLDLNPEAGGGVFARQEPDRLIVTWQRVPAFYHGEDVYTFQAVLHTSGVFEFSYDGLPAALAYLPDDELSARAWVIGAVPGTVTESSLQAVSWLDASDRLKPLVQHYLGRFDGAARVQSPQYVGFGRLASGATLSGGPAGLVQDYYLDFRRHLHTLLLPLAYLLLGASLLTLLAFPSLFRLNLVKPLEMLLAGVRRVNAGDLDATTPVQYRDEIGFLTESFNTMTVSLRTERNELQKTAEALRGLSATLETRVAARTADLAQANTQLREEIAERQAAQAQVVAQERTLAAAEEREHLGRELHDGLGQVLGYLNVQAQTVETLLDQGKTDMARTNLRQMAHAAQQGHADVRSFILGFRAAGRRSFGEALQEAVAGFERQAGIPVALELAQPWDERWLSPVAEVHLLRIIGEALNNVHQHVQAQHVTLTLAQAGDRLRVTVADDGVGFRIADFGLPIANDEASIANRKLSIENPQSAFGNHFGLANMHERAAELCGALTIESALGRGTRVIVECPIQTPCATTAAPARPQRVLLVDDHPMFLDGLAGLLTAHGMAVVGLGQDGFEAQTLARALRPDLIVMDLQMPGCDGLEATRRIKAEWPGATIVILTVSAAEEHLFAALEAGAAGYLLKNLQAEEFLGLLAGLEQGAPPIAPELAARIQGELGQTVSQRGQTAALNQEQTNILRLMAQGLTYRQVGRQLHLSEAGVKYQMKQILERLHLANRSQVEAYARRSGLGGEGDTVTR